MHLTIYALGLFGAAWVIHLGWWNWAPPRRHTPALLVLFLSVLAIGMAVGPRWSGGWGPQDGWEMAYVLVLAGPLALAYVAFYSAIEEDSPSLALVAMTQRAGANGCQREDFSVIINDDLLSGSRLAALARDGYVQITGGRCQLTTKGRRLARALAVVARLFGFSKSA